MGDKRAASGLGQADRRIDDLEEISFGDIDLELRDDKPSPGPTSEVRTAADKHTRDTLRRAEDDDDDAIEEAAPIEMPELDGFGGLLPVEDDGADPLELLELLEVQEVPETKPFPAAAVTAPPIAPVESMPVLASLTERQGIPRIILAPSAIARLPLDHRAGFLLAAIDGMQTMEEILDVCAMPAVEALELIRGLVKMGVVVIE